MGGDAGAVLAGELLAGDGDAGVVTGEGVQPVAAKPPPSTIARNNRSIFTTPLTSSAVAKLASSSDPITLHASLYVVPMELFSTFSSMAETIPNLLRSYD